MSRRRTSASQTDEELVEDEILDDADENVEPDETAPVTAEDKAAEDAQLKQEQAEAQLKADLKVASAKSEVQDLEERLKEAKKTLANAEVEASTVDTPVANRPCCLPQHDPTIRSARSKHEAQQMVEVLRKNNGPEVKLKED